MTLVLTSSVSLVTTPGVMVMLVFSVTLMVSCRADAEISVVFVFSVVLVIAAALMSAPAGRADAEVLPAGNPEEMLNRLVSMSLNFGMRRRDKGEDILCKAEKAGGGVCREVHHLL